MEIRSARLGGRRSIRIEDYDYSQESAYFVTICSQDRACVFGEVVNDEIELCEIGQSVLDGWMHLRDRFPSLILDTFMIMPNHVHGLIVVTQSVGAGSPRPLTRARGHSNAHEEGAETAPLHRPKLGQIVAYFKYQTTKLVNKMRGTPGARLWQRNYYEHVIRNEEELRRARAYILTNPLRWAIDREHPESGRNQ
jgi:putative transposase